ncbi:MAG: hypothetical protein OSB61_06555, partial [Verrucomicrobiota bacterium]|nr:hypothetical protein [Verrucomicrobiota bacterium]
AAFFLALRFGAAFFLALRFGAAFFLALRFGAAFLFTALRLGAAFFLAAFFLALRFGAAFLFTAFRLGAAFLAFLFAFFFAAICSMSPPHFWMSSTIKSGSICLQEAFSGENQLLGTVTLRSFFVLAIEKTKKMNFFFRGF